MRRRAWVLVEPLRAARSRCQPASGGGGAEDVGLSPTSVLSTSRRDASGVQTENRSPHTRQCTGSVQSSRTLNGSHG